MRSLFAGLVTAGVLTSQVALAASQCAQPRDRSAFDIAGLKSELMVIALTCDVRDKYDGFVMRHRSELQAEEKALQGYFARAFGRRGVQEHDDYITQLANAQSETGLQRGTLFCSENTHMFDEVMAIPAGGDLPGYAASKSLTQPVTLVACVAPAPKVKRTRTAQANTMPTAVHKQAQ